jgi:hypothetical protein
MTDADAALTTTAAVWERETDAVLRGLAHALSNRVAALVLSAGELTDPDTDVAAEAASRVVREGERLREIDRVLKLLPRDRRAREEALELREVVDAAVALHRQRADLRDREVRVTVDAGVLPVRVERAALMRALVLLLAVATRPAEGDDVLVRVAGDAERAWVEITTEDDGAQRAATDDSAEADRAERAARVDAAAALLRAMQGEVEQDARGAWRAVLPSLPELRRREREAAR